MRNRVADPPAPNLRIRRVAVFGAVEELLGFFVGTPFRVAFGAFTLDVGSRQLLRGSERAPVHLSPKAFELLRILVEARPTAISRRELHQRIWPSTFVSEATLSSLIAELREALGESGRQGGAIRTVHGFGFAFAGAAERPAADDAAIANWIVCEGHETPLGVGAHLLGRDTDVKVTLRSPGVSRHHARIVISSGAATLEDLGSKNGTYVRGQRLTSPVQLADGDEIRIATFVLRFRTVSAKGSTETQAR